MTDDDRKWDRDQNVPKYNEKANQPRESDLSKNEPETDLETPKLSLQDGPKPPTGIEEAVKKQVREAKAIERSKKIMGVDFANPGKTEYNHTGYDDSISDEVPGDKGDEGI